MSVVSIRKINSSKPFFPPVIIKVDELSGTECTGAVKECPYCKQISMKSMDPLDAAEDYLECAMCGYSE